MQTCSAVLLCAWHLARKLFVWPITRRSLLDCTGRRLKWTSVLDQVAWPSSQVAWPSMNHNGVVFDWEAAEVEEDVDYEEVGDDPGFGSRVECCLLRRARCSTWRVVVPYAKVCPVVDPYA